MKTKKKLNTLACALRDFFSDNLPNLRGMSPHTIHSYRDCLTLLLKFVSEVKKCSVVKLDILDIDEKQVIAFLQMLEKKRGNSSTTRNVRLSAIHVFFRYFSGKYPLQLEHCQRILSIPFKRANQRTVEYLEYEEIQAVLSAVDRSTRDGARDYALLVTMFNTGARVQEILDLRVCDLTLIKPYQVRLFGKGRKERICPLWEQTANLLDELLEDRCNLLSVDFRIVVA